MLDGGLAAIQLKASSLWGWKRAFVFSILFRNGCVGVCVAQAGLGLLILLPHHQAQLGAKHLKLEKKKKIEPAKISKQTSTKWQILKHLLSKGLKTRCHCTTNLWCPEAACGFQETCDVSSDQ